MERRLRTVRSVHRTAGGAGVAYMLLRRLGLPRTRLEWFVVFEHHLPNPNAAFRRAHEGDLPALAACDRGPQVAQDRLARGRRCAIAERERDVAGWIRITPEGTYDEGGLIFHLGPHDARAYDGLVDPVLRGRGIASRLKRAVVADLRDPGIERVVSTVDRLDTSSLRSSVRSGHEVARFLQIQIGRLGVVRIAGAGRRARRRSYLRRLDLRVPADI